MRSGSVVARVPADRGHERPGKPVAELCLEALPGGRTAEVRHSTDEGTVTQETLGSAALRR
jgi:hypothetical protein